MSIFSSTQPSLRARLLPRFPARVLGGTGITVTKANGTYTFALTLGSLPLSGFEDIATDTLLGRDSVGSGSIEQIAVSNGLGFTGTGVLGMSANQRLRSIDINLFNAGAVLTTGIKQDLEIPFACTIQKWTLLADQSGSIVVDIWKDTFANYPPVVGDSITAAAKPTISAANKAQSSTLTGWTTNIAAGDTLRFNIDSVATVTRVALSLEVTTV